MRTIAVVLCFALVMSVSFVPPVHASNSDDSPNLLLSVAGLAALIWIFATMSAKGKVLLEEQREAEIQAYADANPDVSPVIIDAIRNKNVVIGMTAEQVRLSIGKPTTVNRTVTAAGVREQWVYRSSLYNTRYIYLENGVVTSWQD